MNDVDEELVNCLYVEVWKLGCKGCMVYCDGFCLGVLIFVKFDKDKKEEFFFCKLLMVVEVCLIVFEVDVVCF